MRGLLWHRGDGVRRNNDAEQILVPLHRQVWRWQKHRQAEWGADFWGHQTAESITGLQIPNLWHLILIILHLVTAEQLWMHFQVYEVF
jgi:hypothetical protein